VSTHYVLKIQYVNKPPETRNIGARVTTIGREAGDIVLGDAQSSGRHAEIYFENGNVRVKDLGSTNGTFYNGQRTPEFTLQAGQGFSIGQTVMTLMAVHDAAAQRPGAGKTMIAMGGRPAGLPGAPPRPPGAPPPAGFGAPPGAPPAGFGAPPPGPAPAGFGAPPPGPAPAGFGAPPPGPAPAGFGGPPPGPPPAGFGAPPPSSPPPGAPPQGFGAPPPQGGFGAPPPGGPPPGFGAAPPGGGFGGPPPGGPPPGGFGAPPPSDPSGQMAPTGGAFPAAAAPPMSPPAQQFGGQQQPFGGGPGPMMASPGGEIRGDFSGTGGELFGQLFVGFLLTAITFGFYMPWFSCKLLNFVAQRITFGPTAKGTVRASFEGKGGELFVLMLVNGLLTVITLYIYLPWAMCKFYNWMANNIVIRSDSGEEYRLRFDGKGGDLFVTGLVGAILCIITLYIYMPWFICKMNRWMYSHVKITKNGQEVGGLEFNGEGGDLFVTFLVGVLLSVITLYIYMPWFQCKIWAWMAEHTKINVEGKRYGMRFSGQGGELFVIGLVGMLLMIVTLYIYSFWFMAKMLKWQLSNLAIQPEGGAPMAMGAPMGGGPAFGAAPPQGQMYGQPPQGQIGAPGYGGPPQGGYGGPPQGGYGGPPQGGGYA
jgi:uncharacterized membrane protein YjgN (DUF898 family)